MYIDRLIFVLILSAYFLSPSMLSWISSGGTAWYRPYLIWLAIIVINFWLTPKPKSRPPSTRPPPPGAF